MSRRQRPSSDLTDLAAFLRACPGDALAIAADRRRLERFAHAARASGREAIVLPPWDVLPYERASPSRGVMGRRIDAVLRLAETEPGSRTLLTSLEAAFQRLPPVEALGRAFRAAVGKPIDVAALRRFLDDEGYLADSLVDAPGEYAQHPDRIELFPASGDERLLLRIRDGVLTAIEADGRELRRLAIGGASELPQDEAAWARAEGAWGARRRFLGMEHWLPLLQPDLTTVFDLLPDAQVALDELADPPGWHAGLVESYEARRGLHDPAREPALLRPEALYLGEAEWRAAIEGRSLRRVSVPVEPAAAEPAAAEAEDEPPFRLGDYVVHLEHGLGRFDGLETVQAGESAQDCARLIFRGGDRLLVPSGQFDQLRRYGGGEARELDALRRAGWDERKAKVKARLFALAEGLLAQAAERQRARPEPIEPPEPAYARFCARFPHVETAGQLRAIDEVRRDLASGRLMDRLVCGDAGVGKTEVALRAAFIVAMSGRQVVVAAPTTPLAHQHFETFRARFAGFPAPVAQLSRAVPAAEAKQVRAGLADGSIRVVVGTHAVLARSVRFADLALLVVDEEQRFGVRQKERLKQAGRHVHALAMTATPIPRTLQLALHGLRDLSAIDTPPAGRRPVRARLAAYDEGLVRDALARERARGGQSFYIVPRVRMLEAAAERIARLAPALVAVRAHGRMPATELAAAVEAFVAGDADVLLATNVVEAGLDIPNANTLIVERADLFGLAQLYQLKGRVGRSRTQGRALLTWGEQEPSAEARRRLEAMREAFAGGAGLRLAQRDMELRGGGDLLGDEQAGHLRDVGIELYQEMLSRALEAARARRSEAAEPQAAPTVELGAALLVPSDYEPDQERRAAVYRRLAAARDETEIARLRAALAERRGPPPPAADALFAATEIRLLAERLGVAELEAGPRGAALVMRPGYAPAPDLERVGPRLVRRARWPHWRDRVAGVLKLLRRWSDGAGARRASVRRPKEGGMGSERRGRAEEA